MNNKLIIATILLFISFSTCAQNKIKHDLYLYFSPDSNSYKLIRKQNASIINNQYFPDEVDVYGLKFISENGTNIIYKLFFSTTNKNRYSVTDSLGLKGKKIVPFKNLPLTKGIQFDSTDKKNFPYAKVFIIEKIAKEQFKIIQVQSYIGSDEINSQPIKK